MRAADSFFVYNNPQTGYSVYIDDDQDLLTDAEEQSLIEEMIPITEYGNVGFISCDNTSESTASYSARRYSSLFGSDSGAVLVIDMGQRMIYIKNNGAVSKIITNAYSNTITDNIYRYASDGDYYSCASAAFSQIYTVLRGGKIAQPMRYISAALLALVIGFLINYLFLRAVTSPNKAGQGEIIDAAKVDFEILGRRRRRQQRRRWRQQRRKRRRPRILIWIRRQTLYERILHTDQIERSRHGKALKALSAGIILTGSLFSSVMVLSAAVLISLFRIYSLSASIQIIRQLP